MTIILDGKKVSTEINEEVKKHISILDYKPGLGIVLVGRRPDSELYVKMKRKTCEYVGIENFDYSFNENVDEEKVIECIEKMNKNPNIHGILVQLPLPKHLNKQKILNTIQTEKDVDGFSEINNGKLTLNLPATFSCTPVGCIELLDRYQIELEGKNAVIIGASNTVGLPLSLMLLHRGSTITLCHIKTKNTKELVQQADLVFVCCGCAQMVKSDWLKKDCIVVDIGINKMEDLSRKNGYKIVGDCDYNDIIDSEKAYAITPVPGGAGPMTVAILMKNTLQCAQKLNENQKNEISYE